ncbi:MAG: hypothetical protein ACYTXY_11435 [Nostoc sp.]
MLCPYQWRSGIFPDMSEGLAKAEELLTNGVIPAKLQQLSQLVSAAFVPV